MQHLYPDPSPFRTNPLETWLPSLPPTTLTLLLSPHPLPRPVPEELSSARIQTPPRKGLARAQTPHPGSDLIMRLHLRFLREPRLLPLPLTPVGPEGPGQLRLSVPVTPTSGGVTLAGSAQTVSSRPLMDTSLRLAHWNEIETVWEPPQNWTAHQCSPLGTKPSLKTTVQGQAGPQAISEQLVRILCC